MSIKAKAIPHPQADQREHAEPERNPHAEADQLAPRRELGDLPHDELEAGLGREARLVAALTERGMSSGMREVCQRIVAQLLPEFLRITRGLRGGSECFKARPRSPDIPPQQTAVDPLRAL